MTDDDKQCQESAASANIQHGGAVVNMETAETNSLNGTPTTVTKDEICEYLSGNSRIFFRSQQIDDPDLTNDEKKTIALDLYNFSSRNFLIRFGKHLQKEHIKHFEADTRQNDDEMNFLIKDLLDALKSHSRNVKNRRYAAMQAMIKAGNYFSECEMMRRDPHLYEQMVGQYLTDTEKRIRDRSSEECSQFSNVLLENYDKDEMEKLRKKQAQEEQDDTDDDTTVSEKSEHSQSVSYSSENDRLYPQIPASQRKQWGEFLDDDPQRDMGCPGLAKKKAHKHDERFITAGEREMLRQEFVGMMYEKFLEGQDKEFDYEAVDDNADLDDLQQIGQDREDKYFECDEDNDDAKVDDIRETLEERQESDSEDELEVYMKHLSNEPSVERQIDK